MFETEFQGKTMAYAQAKPLKGLK